MKHIPDDLKAHLGGEVITLCRCWILETVNGERLGFTDHDRDILLDGVLCQKDAGVESGNIEERIGLDVNSGDISGALQSAFITEADIDAGKYDNARVSTYLVNWSNPEQYVLDRASLVGEITREDSFYKMELRGLASQLDQTKGNHFVARCSATLGDNRCKVVLDNPQYSGIGQVEEVQSRFVLSVSNIESFSDGWFRGGRLEWRTGENTGRSIGVVEHSRFGSLTLVHMWQPMPFAVSPGDTFDIFAGCDKDFHTCKTKFSNHLNFRGFPHIPGNDETLVIASNNGNFDGGPIVS